MYQHPPQSRHLADVLRKLTTQNSQVMVCTHSPHFVSGEAFEKVRLVRKDVTTSRATVACATWDQVAASIKTATGKEWKTAEAALAKIHQALKTSVSEMFFTPTLVLVEGVEDVAFITAYLNLAEKWEEWRRVGCHIVPVDGKSHMLQPLAVAKALRIPTFVIFDSDGHEVREDKRNAHARDNVAILSLCGIDKPDPLPKDTFWGNGVVSWSSEIGRVVADEMGTPWNVAKAEIEARYGHIGDLAKNALFIGDCLLLAWDQGGRSKSLERLCTEILAFARGTPAADAATTS